MGKVLAGGCWCLGEENLNSKFNTFQIYLRKYLWGGRLAGGAWVRRISAAEDYPDDELPI